MVASRGETGAAATLFDHAAQAFDGVDLALHAAVARRRRGLILGGDAGAALVTRAEAWMREQKIQRPDRMTAMLAPGAP